ncbi:CotH kinase family protein, partial [Akkermansiaceae bacterium]|nr:CotH kinase family protein [Akkermansiaceae bacterium]
MQKHSLRVTFSSQVGIGKLRHNLFPDSPVDSFNKLVLRACFTDSWALNSWSTPRYRPNDSQYFRDVWMKDSMTAMGHASGHGNFVHLYLNGVYFGLHNLSERIEDDWYSDHIGGERADWKINKDLETAIPEWNSMLSNLTNWEVAQTKIDVENYADYMLLHFFADAEDWPHHNGYAAANFASGDGKFRFQVWDQEIALDHYSRNRYDDGRGGGAPFQRLRQLEDFRILFADRTYKHMFDGGALTVEKAGERYLKWAGEIDKAIVAESARWGDVQASTPYGNIPGSTTGPNGDNFPPLLNSPAYFTREQHWIVERDHVVNNYLPVLHNVDDSRSILRELRAENLYPSIDPPLFSQLGGVVAPGFPLSLTAPDGSVVYTTDGSDPRLPGGAINPTAGEFASSVVVPVIPFVENNWKFLDTAVAQSSSNVVVGHPSYNNGDWKNPDFDDTSWSSGISPFAGSNATAVNGFRENTIVGSEANTLLNVRPGADSTPTMYFRKSFNIAGVDDHVSINGTAVRDDAIIVYLNGREIFRDTVLGNQTIDYSDYVGSNQDETEVLEFSYPLNPGDLLEGDNVIAIEVHNASTTSGDIGLALKLDAVKTAESGSTVNLVETGTVKARVRLLNGEWSALREADFIVGTPAAPGFLVISEIMYNPQGPNENLEYLELLNISPNVPIDMTGVAITNGILYQFPTGFILPPLTHVVIVKDQTAFATAYDTSAMLIAPGNFESNLSNGGEGITLIGNSGISIQ